jgi:hypothetical protein
LGLALLTFRAAAFVQKTKHDAVSIGLAALDGTVSSRWPVTVPRSGCGCRGAGFAVGALVAGMVANLLGLTAAIWLAPGCPAFRASSWRPADTRRRRRGRTGRRYRATPQP